MNSITLFAYSNPTAATILVFVALGLAIAGLVKQEWGLRFLAVGLLLLSIAVLIGHSN